MKGYKIGFIVSGLVGALAYGTAIAGFQGLALICFIVASVIGIISLAYLQ